MKMPVINVYFSPTLFPRMIATAQPAWTAVIIVTISDLWDPSTLSSVYTMCSLLIVYTVD